MSRSGDDEPRPGDAASASLLDRLAGVLDAEPLVDVWFAEAGSELLLRLGPVPGCRAALEGELERIGIATGAGRIRVERPSVVRARLEANGGEPVAG